MQRRYVSRRSAEHGHQGNKCKGYGVNPRISINSAKRKLRNIDAKAGFASRREFCGHLSDAVAESPHLAKNLTWSKNPVKRHLYMACSASTTEWYLNNGRIRRDATLKLLKYMACGTTGVEALNAELKRRPHGISHLHAPILRLKLRIFQISKMISFCKAKYNPGSAQARQSIVLCEALQTWKICNDWGNWCMGKTPIYSNANNAIWKGPEMETRERDAMRLKVWKGKCVKKKITKKPNRTPFRSERGRRRADKRVPVEW